MSDPSPLFIYALMFASAVLAMQIFIGLGKYTADKVKGANDRMKRLSKEKNATVVLAKLNTRRGMTKDGELEGFLIRVKQLVLQSGLPLGNYGFYFWLAGSTLGFTLFAFLLKSALVWTVAGLLFGLGFPFLVLKFFVKRRRNKAASQLPDALDVIIRSLGAGHPVPVSMSLVGREMADPIGTEFGVTSDEISYGASVSQSVQRLSDRVGHEDFDLFSAMIRLQERTGGNLAELLRKSAGTIRDRQKMRLKIRAASAEGRASAIILNFAPVLLFIFINIMAPDFYGDVRGEKVTTYAIYGIVGWMVIGNLVMRKMINFKI